MPAATVQENYFTAAAGVDATQADGVGRTAPATRYKIRIVNTHLTDRLYVAFSEAEAERTSPLPEVVEPDFGVWDAYVEAGQAIWVRPSGTAGIAVRVLQYAT